MSFAKIVGSTSHVTYIARMLADGEASGDGARGFGAFVSMTSGDEATVGVICDSRLVNPEYAASSPRLGQANALSELKRDQIDENKALIAILLLGSISGGNVSHQVPRNMLPAGTEVVSMDADAVRKFHTARDGSVQMHYLPNLITQTGSLATPLANYIIEQVGTHFPDNERRRLAVMSEALAWKHAFGESRF